MCIRDSYKAKDAAVEKKKAVAGEEVTRLMVEALALSEELAVGEKRRREFNDEMRAIMEDAVADSLETGRFIDSMKSALNASRPKGGVSVQGGGAALDVGSGEGAWQQQKQQQQQQPLGPPLLTHPPLFIADMKEGGLESAAISAASAAEALSLSSS